MSIIYRKNKGEPLIYQDLDDNFEYLENSLENLDKSKLPFFDHTSDDALSTLTEPGLYAIRNNNPPDKPTIRFSIMWVANAGSDYIVQKIQDRREPQEFFVRWSQDEGSTWSDWKKWNIDEKADKSGETFTGIIEAPEIVAPVYVRDARENSDVPGSNGSSGYLPDPEDEFLDKRLIPIFSQGFGGSSWRAGIILKGWAQQYAAWSLSGPASTSADDDFYLQSGIQNVWRTARKIALYTPESALEIPNGGNDKALIEPSDSGTGIAVRTLTNQNEIFEVRSSGQGIRLAVFHGAPPLRGQSSGWTIGGRHIAQSGSNSDGEWTRWYDGTQICSGMTNAGGWRSFPVSFNSAPTVTFGVAWGDHENSEHWRQPQIGDGQLYSSGFTSYTYQGGNIRGNNPPSSGVNGTYIAYGRW
jgi:hypothetical protein